jgi:hypothetical protein
VAPRCLTTVKCTLKPDLWLYRSEFSFVCEYVVNVSVYCVVIVCCVNKLLKVIVIDFVGSYSKQNSLGPNPVFVFNFEHFLLLYMLPRPTVILQRSATL